MPPNAGNDSFQARAIASGLVTRDELDHARDAVRAGNGGGAVSDKDVARKLVELGRLNEWQAEQMLGGRSKFHLGPYRILDSIGQGGMGRVYKAEHNIMRRVVAIKVLPHHKTTPDSVANFVREIQAQAQLDHENLVRAYDAGQDGNVHYLVTEYVPGTDLRRLIRRNGRLTMQAAASVIAQGARGLDHAHKRGLIHRDVKPGNLLVTPEGRCKVSDLGLVGYFSGRDDDLRKDKIVGTADYLSPEQILKPDKLTPACDIYALGCTLYYSVTGKVPFPGGTTQDKARNHCKNHPLDPRRLNPELTDPFVELIAAMMVKEPLGRVQSASEVAERLASWAGEAEQLAAKGVMAWAEASKANSTLFTLSHGGGGGEDQGDTRPIVDDDFGGQELEELEQLSQVSQISQRTLPMTAATEETLPMFDPRPAGSGGGSISPGVTVLIAIGLGTVVAVLGAIFILALISR